MTRTTSKNALVAMVVTLLTGVLLSPVWAAPVDRQTLELRMSGSELIKTDFPFRRVSIANPEIADVVVLSPRELYVFGKKLGYTSIILWEEGQGKTLLDVVVNLDLTALKKKLFELYPDQAIEVYSTETGVVLSGTVTGPEVMEQVLRLTQAYLPKLAEDSSMAESATGASGKGITNLLHIGGIQQVMLEVRFAEVTRDSGKDWQAALGLDDVFGQSVTGVAGASSLPLNSINPITGTLSGAKTGALLLNFANLASNPANIFVNVADLTAALRFLETEGMARVLAEPRLVTQSGREASFLAGGEFPIPVVGAEGEVEIEYKDFGVSLKFTPTILSGGLIGLEVSPSVSDIASTSTIPTGGVTSFVVPNLSTRKLNSTVQLYDGQTLALAGLLQDNMRGAAEKVPGLGDIPVLGALFRSQDFQQEKTDLLIAVTPHLVKPVPEGSIQMPGADIQPPDRAEFYLLGRIEGGRNGAAKAPHEFNLPASTQPEKSGGLEGDFGPQPMAAK